MSDEPPPIPQVAPPAPLTALPLDYVPPDQTGRPGVVTAIGVMSIIVAVLSGVASAIAAFSVAALLAASQISLPKAPVSAPPTPAAKAAGMANQPSLVVGPHGLEAAERKIAINGLRQNHPLTSKRVQMLDAILADSGQDMFAFGGAGFNAAAVAASVSDSGQVHKLSGEAGPDFFILGSGRLELYDDHAVYMPSDGRDPVRISEDEIAVEGNVLTPADVQTAIHQAQVMCGNKLSAAQVASLKSQLEAPSQWLIDKTKNVPIASQFRSVQVQPNGDVMIQSINGFVMMDVSGAVTYSMSAAGFMGPGGGGSPIKVSSSASLLVILASVLSIGLAVYLLVAGILTLRQSLKGRKLHFIYAAIKIPLAIAAIIGVYWVTTSFLMNSPMIPPQARNQAARTGAAIFYAALAGLGLIYPIALLIALNTRGVREYYSGVQQDRS
jgi:hypothetical protein